MNYGKSYRVTSNILFGQIGAKNLLCGLNGGSTGQGSPVGTKRLRSDL